MVEHNIKPKVDPPEISKELERLREEVKRIKKTSCAIEGPSERL
jgi:hypothetical protein